MFAVVHLPLISRNDSRVKMAISYIANHQNKINTHFCFTFSVFFRYLKIDYFGKAICNLRCQLRSLFIYRTRLARKQKNREWFMLRACQKSPQNWRKIKVAVLNRLGFLMPIKFGINIQNWIMQAITTLTTTLVYLYDHSLVIDDRWQRQRQWVSLRRWWNLSLWLFLFHVSHRYRYRNLLHNRPIGKDHTARRLCILGTTPLGFRPGGRRRRRGRVFPLATFLAGGSA